MRIDNNNKKYNSSFKAMYKVPAARQDVAYFEKHIAPLHEYFQGTPIKAFDTKRAFFYVFTGKEDVALFDRIKPKTLGVTTHIVEGRETPIKYVETAVSNYDAVMFNKNIAKEEVINLSDFLELVKKVLRL